MKLLRRMNGADAPDRVVDVPAPDEPSVSLDDLDRALAAVEVELVEAEADRERIPDLEAALGDLDVDERLGEIAADVAGKRRAELEAEIVIVGERPDRLAGEVERLRMRCIEAGEAAAREAIAAWAEPLRKAEAAIAVAEQLVRERQAERDRVAANIASARQAFEQVRLRYDPEARRRAAERERYDREVARSIAAQGKWRWPKDGRLLPLIEAERARLEEEEGAGRQRERDLAAASWSALGEFAGTRPEFLDHGE
jgi:DNA repair exonuclease SbcCD ATPase subunit